MRVFLQCVAEAVAENGLKGLAQMIPGGGYAYDVAEAVYKKYRERCKEEEQAKEFQQLAAAKLDEARAEVVQIARHAFALVPAGVAAEPTSDEIIDLELYLTAIPDAVRQSLKRPDDATGTTLPADFRLRSADDVLKVLPPRPPRFRPGADLPGKPGWVLDRLLGMGGFGEVWFARHARMGSLSGAVKFCFGQSGRDLIHEAGLIDRVMAAGRHPHIVPLTDAHLEGDSPWLMFEYVGGGTLTDFIHRIAGRPAERRLADALAGLTQLCEAVAYFHALPVPVVHRDLKPSNILLDAASGKLRITDFGIGSVTARETNRQESRGGGTRGGRLLSYLRGSHTPLYSSPQQRGGSDPDPRDDVHALGVIAYQMLTGKLDAAPGPRAGTTLKKAGVPDEVAELLLNCVSEEVDDRPLNAGEVLKLLPAAKAGSGTPPPVSAGHSPTPPQRAGVGWVAESLKPAEVPATPTPPRGGGVAGSRSETGGGGAAEAVTPTSPLAGEVGTRSVPGGGASKPSPKPNPPATQKKPHVGKTFAELAAEFAAEPESVQATPPVVPLVAVPPPVRKAGDRFELALPGGVKMAFAWCPPGTFLMGSPMSEPKREEEELQHEVRLTKGFYTGVHPVTQAEWKAVMNTDPSHFKGANLPVEQVSWNDAQEFCQKVRELTGKAVRLPTEAEWEYACRGGTTTPFYWGTELNGTQANSDGQVPYGTSMHGPYLKMTTPVGSYAEKFPHPWGLADVHGNVFEWCQDWFDAGFYARSPKDDPECQGGERGHRVIRGGSWYGDVRACRAAARRPRAPMLSYWFIGFRLVLPEQD